MLKEKQQWRSTVDNADTGETCGPVRPDVTPFFPLSLFLLLPVAIYLVENTVWQSLLTFVWGIVATLITLSVRESDDGDGV